MTSRSASYGIILFKKVKNQLLFLLIKKKYSYHFSDIVSGNYTGISDFLTLTSKLTYDEKELLMTGNFNLIWSGIYSNRRFQTNNFHKCKNKFSGVYKDNKEKIHQYLLSSSVIENKWELPKGHKINTDILDVDAALREFTEETNIKRSDYKLSNDWGFLNFSDRSIDYRYKFFIAKYTTENYVCNYDFLRHSTETCGCKFLSLSEIKVLSHDYYYNFLLEMTQKIKEKIRNGKML